MKKSTKIEILIAIILWLVGSIIIFKKGTSNPTIIISAVIIIIAIVSRVRVTKKSS
jgi:hypothetical protein